MLLKRLGQLDTQAGDPDGESLAEGLQALRARFQFGGSLHRGAVLQERYEIQGVIGVGGMSTVYSARDLRFPQVVRLCAIKEMFNSSPDPEARQAILSNFEREASLLATLSHGAIPKIYDFFDEDGRIYLVLEYLSGANLEKVLEERGTPLPEDDVLRWGIEICDVLEYLHRQAPTPIIFRDIKPSNLLLRQDGTICLIDFGIAKVLQAEKRGTVVGTEGYSAPEQYRGLAEPATDVYALGATLHHLLTGIDPRLETPFTFHLRPVRGHNPSVSPALEATIMRALEYDLARRFQTIPEMRAALEACRQGEFPAELEAWTMEALAARGGGQDPGPSTPRAGTLAWKFVTDDEVRSTSLLVDATLYVGSYDTMLYALDAHGGELLWKAPTRRGICSSPAAWRDLIVVGSEDRGLYAFATPTGEPRWVFPAGMAIRSSPRVFGNSIAFGCDDQYVYCLAAETGQLKWRFRTWLQVRSSPVQVGGQLVIGSSDGHVYALGLEAGDLIWKFQTGDAVISTAASDARLVYVGSNDGSLYALDAATGAPVWRFRTGGKVTSSPCVTGSLAIVGSADRKLYALDHATGAVVWSYEVGGQLGSSPRVSGGRVYIGCTDGFLYCLDARQGEPLWQYRTDAPIAASPTVTEDLVYIGSLDRTVYALWT